MPDRLLSFLDPAQRLDRGRMDLRKVPIDGKLIRGKPLDRGLQRFITARFFPQRRLGSGNNHVYSSSRAVGLDAHRPRQLENPFSHASDPNTRTSGLNLGQSFDGHALTFIPDFQGDRFVILDDAYAGGLTS